MNASHSPAPVTPPELPASVWAPPRAWSPTSALPSPLALSSFALNSLYALPTPLALPTFALSTPVLPHSAPSVCNLPSVSPAVALSSTCALQLPAFFSYLLLLLLPQLRLTSA